MAGIRALAAASGGFLEVRGELVLRRDGRVRDRVNHPDPMLELEAAALRFTGPEGPELWEHVETMSLNLDRCALVAPVEEDGVPAETPGSSPVRVKVVCPGVAVTGFLTVPRTSTVAAHLHETGSRFLHLAQARVIPAPGAPALEELAGVRPACLVNRAQVLACIDTRGGRES